MPNKKKTRRRPLTFEDVREIALSLPEAWETTAWGVPAFRAVKTLFAVEPHPRPDVAPNSFGVPMSFEQRARLLAARPDVYYLNDHWAKSAGVLVRLSSISRAELREILSAAWHHAMERQARKGKTRRRKSTRTRPARR